MSITPATDHLAAPSLPEDAVPPRESPAGFAAKALAFDEARDSFAGEHALVFAAGLGLLLAATSRSPLARALVAAAGVGCIVRSLSGRDGVAALLPDRE